MSIVGTSYHDPQEWKADKKEVSRCQESIQCQERAMLRAETFGSVLRQNIDRMEERLEMKKQDFLHENASVLGIVNSLTVRMDEVVKLQAQIIQQNNNVAELIQQLIDQKRATDQSGIDWYNEAAAQFVLMEYNREYLKFAEIEMNNLRARIEQGKTVDWTSAAMQVQAERLLSDVYLIGLKVVERRSQYEECQQKCVQQAMSILEQASEFRSNGVLYGYHIGQDVDYWTSNALRSVEQEVQKILDKITEKVNDSTFQTSELNAMLAGLKELALEKDKIIDCAMENARRSERVQAEVRHAAELLIDRHDFKLVGANYELGDERRPFIARMRRDTDGMEVEFVCGFDSTTGQYKLAHSMNSLAYSDQNVRDAIEKDLTQSLIDAGLQITSNQTCGAKDLIAYDEENPRVDAQTNAQLNVSPLGYGR